MYRQEEGLKTKIILASGSPRRKQIFMDLGVDFEAVAPDGDLEYKHGDPVRTAVANSVLKAKDVLKRISPGSCRYLISGFDTIVYLGKKIFGKPSDIKEAYSHIEALSGKVHRVVTGICVLDSITGRNITQRAVSEVKFKVLKPEEIKNYLARESVLDKAGAYNIAGRGALLVDSMKGCLFNIIGVPVFKYTGILDRFDYKILYHSKE